MKATIFCMGPAAVCFAMATASAAQTPPPAPERMQSERRHPPVHALETREAMAVAYTGEDTEVSLRGTERLPAASGEAKVERRSGATEIEVELDEMKSASHFGGDFNTYVLWTISPEGLMTNAGEFVLRGNRSKLNVTTPLQTFAMVVTAEPHFAVSIPSSFVVLESTWPDDDDDAAKLTKIRYETLRGAYEFDREAITEAAEPRPGADVHSELAQARTAIDLAERAGAAQHAREAFQRAQQTYEQARSGMGAEDQDSDENPDAAARRLARDAVQQAVEAQTTAEQRAFQTALAQEREARAAKISELETALQSASNEAERAQLEARRKELDLQIEQNARAQMEQQNQRLRAERDVAQAEAAQQRAERQLTTTQTEQEKEQQREEIISSVRAAMGRIGQLSESDRGAMVTLSDAQFEIDGPGLKPQTREALSRLAGVLAASPDLSVTIEPASARGAGPGGTAPAADVAAALSQARARTVQQYLVEAGLPASKVTTGSRSDVRPQPTPPVATLPQPTTPRPTTPPATPGATVASQANAGVVILVYPAEPVMPPAPAPR